MGAPASRIGDPFAPPRREPAADQTALRRAMVFLVGRLLRVGVSPLVLALCIGLALTLEPNTIAFTWLLSVALWAPSSAILFRTTFFPSPPDAWLLAEDGEPRSVRDLRAIARAAVAEDLLGSLPLLWLSGWIGQLAKAPPLIAALLPIGALILVGSRAARSALALVLHESALDIGAGRERAARERLTWLLSRRWIWHSDYGWFLLARARFRDLDVDDALEALDHIRDSARWATASLRAQMAVDRIGPEAARREAERIRPLYPPIADAIEMLVLLHEGRIEEVAARHDHLATLPLGEARLLMALLVAAALAEQAPDRAKALLLESGYSLERARSLARCWPAVSARIERLPS